MNLTWLRDFDCHSTFVCPSLPGLPCGEYAVKLGRGGGGEDEEDVCYQRHLYRSSKFRCCGFKSQSPQFRFVSPGLKTGESLQLAFTHVGGFAEKEGEENIFSCYFWCTREGEMPSIGDNGGGGGLLEAAVLVLHNNLLLISPIMNSF